MYPSSLSGSTDIVPPFQKLSQKYLSSPEKFHTLQSLVLHELHTKTHEAKNSATDALLWLKRCTDTPPPPTHTHFIDTLLCIYRAMEFIQVFISEVAGGEHSLDIAAGKAYTKSLRKYHNWIVRGIFSVSILSGRLAHFFSLYVAGGSESSSLPQRFPGFAWL